VCASWSFHCKRIVDEMHRLSDSFNVSQVYTIIVLPNGGPDLEAYAFDKPRIQGWRQACSLFWQVVRTLGKAEELVDFEVKLSLGQFTYRF
jgi:hypothetical protein